MMDLGDIREGYVDEEELIAAAVETESFLVWIFTVSAPT